MKKKIYFAGSIRGGREDHELYAQLIRYLSQYGQVLTEHVGDREIFRDGEGGLSDEEIFRRDMTWVREADIFIAEVTIPSTGVGYEIAVAEGMNKPVFCLNREAENRNLSAMIAGNPAIKISNYTTLDEAVKKIDNFLKTLDI